MYRIMEALTIQVEVWWISFIRNLSIKALLEVMLSIVMLRKYPMDGVLSGCVFDFNNQKTKRKTPIGFKWKRIAGNEAHQNLAKKFARRATWCQPHANHNLRS